MGKDLPKGFVLDDTGISADLPTGFTIDPEVETASEQDLVQGPVKEDFSAKDAIKNSAEQFLKTSAQIGKGYPLLETALGSLTALYGRPLSGLAGLAGTVKDVDTGDKWRQAVENLLVYKPQTQEGKSFASMLSQPFAKWEEAGSKLGDAVMETTNSPAAATIASTWFKALPEVIGYAAMHPDFSFKVNRTPEIEAAVKKGVMQGVKPKVSGKVNAKANAKYLAEAEEGILDIAENANKIVLKDEAGYVKDVGIPETMEEFSSAIEQRKRPIYEEYTNLLEEATNKPKRRSLAYPLREGEKVIFDEQGKGVAIEGAAQDVAQIIDYTKIADELLKVEKDRALNTHFKAVPKFAKARITQLVGEDAFDYLKSNNLSSFKKVPKQLIESPKLYPLDIQNAIKDFNFAQQRFKNKPSNFTHGQAKIDALIANNYRKNLNDFILDQTGESYQGLKNKYRSLLTLEEDVAKAAFREAKKVDPTMLNFSDVFTGYHVLEGLATMSPTKVGASMSARVLSAIARKRANANNIVKKMFKDVKTQVEKQKLDNFKATQKSRVKDYILDKAVTGTLTAEQVKAYQELKRRGELE